MRKRKHTWVLTPGLWDSKRFEVNGVRVWGLFSVFLVGTGPWLYSVLSQQSLSPNSKTRSTHSTILPLEDGFTAIYHFKVLWSGVWEQSSRKLADTEPWACQRKAHTPAGSGWRLGCAGLELHPGPPCAVPERGLSDLEKPLEPWKPLPSSLCPAPPPSPSSL